jgi:hypothetical protein
MPNVNEGVILAAIQGFELQRAQIDQQISELRALLPNGNRSVVAGSEPTSRKRRKFSHEAIQRMREAQRARWAKVRGESAPSPAPAQAPKKKRRLSPEGLQNIIAATKKRWALKRAEAAKKTAPATKRAAVKAPSTKAAKRAPTKKKAAAKSAPAAAAPAPAQAAG